jgi:MurNAc alpha-1-phosphate uridylyltransferase
LPHLGDGPVFALNSDAVWRGSNVLDDLAKAWRSDRMDALVAVVPPERAKGHLGKGDFVLSDDGRVRRGPGFVYTGAQITTTHRLAAVPEPVFSMNAVWDEMIADERLYGLPYSGLWCDVGQPASIPVAEAMLDA